ncbi:hypothetical protein GCM10009661_31700 [Catellatospora chokoriensis]|uniref:Uncharacterized protein n=1 Tax=Catellatospora chokoriensis TaxID=310353 RepID=A0A8J3JSE0_9ACTN|nr:hypothetical protein [Catellatospora chokoriensis]GIF90212.1 hypothetical protein Cch02nite_36560 [Catellatospora chokoriensis]
MVLLADLRLTPGLGSAIRELDESDPQVQRFVEWAYGFAKSRQCRDRIRSPAFGSVTRLGLSRR